MNKQLLCMDRMMINQSIVGGVSYGACLGCGHVHKKLCDDCLREYFEEYPEEVPDIGEDPISFTFYGTRWVVTFMKKEGKL